MDVAENIFQRAAGQPLTDTHGKLCKSIREIIVYNEKSITDLLPEFEPFPKADVKIRFGKISVPTTAEGENEWEPKSSQ